MSVVKTVLGILIIGYLFSRLTLPLKTVSKQLQKLSQSGTGVDSNLLNYMITDSVSLRKLDYRST